MRGAVRSEPDTPGVRISADALRVSALVAAGVTSGYLWRAAFEREPSSVLPAQIISVEPFAHRPAPLADASVSKRVRRDRKQISRRRRSALARHTERRTTVPRPNGPRLPVAVPVPGGHPEPQKPSRPETTPQPPPSPGPAAAPPVAPRPASTATTGSPSAPVAAPAAGPGTSTSAKGDDQPSRPGWGRGDQNHTHTGPPKKGP
jgi:hypothetical protein